ncbi:hypothetical protein FA13DRAFT_1333384 [Coprinellus micaceus]|uniref:Uncharacterized protein n=1 Tax=Coprinellus micaceus TaxID=71717 RepID=A0A4Y7TP23_COPMI|nr:hypothetical protein FA13DRAFT_1333384 [Coprinellus micaceus]
MVKGGEERIRACVSFFCGSGELVEDASWRLLCRASLAGKQGDGERLRLVAVRHSLMARRGVRCDAMQGPLPPPLPLPPSSESSVPSPPPSASANHTHGTPAYVGEAGSRTAPPPPLSRPSASLAQVGCRSSGLPAAQFSVRPLLPLTPAKGVRRTSLSHPLSVKLPMPLSCLQASASSAPARPSVKFQPMHTRTNQPIQPFVHIPPHPPIDIPHLAFVHPIFLFHVLTFLPTVGLLVLVLVLVLKSVHYRLCFLEVPFLFSLLFLFHDTTGTTPAVLRVPSVHLFHIFTFLPLHITSGLHRTVQRIVCISPPSDAWLIQPFWLFHFASLVFHFTLLYFASFFGFGFILVLAFTFISLRGSGGAWTGRTTWFRGAWPVQEA